MITSIIIESQDCSPLGLLILEYMRSHQLTFAQMAVRLSISHAALRITCDKNGNPGTKLLPRLADVLSITESQLKQLVLENELAQIQQRNS